MIKQTFFLTSLLFQSFFSLAQSTIQDYKLAGTEENNGYVIKKVWLNRYEKPKVELINPVFAEAASVPENATPAALSDMDVIMGMERKRPFMFVRVPVYIAGSGKQAKKLLSFSLKVTEAEQSADTPPVMAKTTASNSVLATGNFYKISIAGRGVYKIDYNFIQSKLGVDPATINTANIRLYGNGGTMLPESNAVSTPDDLTENAIVVMDGGDGAFNSGDYILFYANGPMAWTKDSLNKRFYHQKNVYEDKSYYFLNFDQGPGLRVAQQSGTLTPTTTVTSYNDYGAHDEDLMNVGKFGKVWWGEEFSTEIGKQSTRTFSFNTGNTTSNAFIRMHFGSRSETGGNILTVKLNTQSIGTYNIPPISTGSESNPIEFIGPSYDLPITGSAAEFTLNYAPGASTGKGFLDFLELNWRRALSFQNGQVNFRDWNSVGASNVASYELTTANANTVVWDITDPLHPVRMPGNLAGGTYTFAQDAARLHEFVAFDGSQFNTPEFVKKADNQNLHGLAQTDYIIVTHKDFMDAANKLADFHRQKNNLRVVVATTDQIYNEFGSGSQDIGAIRNFARMFYKRAGLDTNEMPRYLLLLGDASYDYKDRIADNTNYVPTYETSESVALILGYCSDDYFSFMDDNEDIENWGIANTMDIGVGRFPVITSAAANGLVDKIIGYASPAALGPWRISTTIVTDNGDGNQHFRDGEVMAATINSHTNLYNENKIHLSAIPTVSTPGGARAPEANKAINDAVFKGTFLLNYNGHGSIVTMAHERILTQDDFNTWKNRYMLPIMVTATCDFSKYDDPAFVSAGEKLIIKADGGAIALLTTTQLVYAHLNEQMNKAYLDATFKQYADEWPTFGDAFRYSKNATYSSPQDEETLANYRKFVLLGDPALTPAYPKHRVATEGIVDGDTQLPVDTMKALGKYQINGSVKNTAGQVLNDFNGRLYVTIYDKPRTVNLLSSTLTFKVQNNVIYKGKVTVTNGQFSFIFIAPKDLNYDFGKGKISYYAENGDVDAAGTDTAMVIGGFSDNPVADNNPPIVKPYMNDSLFRDGAITGSNTLLHVQLFDETGINVSGNGIGHDLTAILDENVEAPYILNDYYETAPNNYQKGYVNFPLSGLTEGKHTIRVKAWDMNNNSGEGAVHFVVVNGKVMAVQNLMNYPNPFKDVTHFVFEHNHPDEAMKVQIHVFSTAGTLARTIEENITPAGSRTNEITWDGTDDNGAKLPSGIYVYKMVITTASGIQAVAHQKAVLVR